MFFEQLQFHQNSLPKTILKKNFKQDFQTPKKKKKKKKKKKQKQKKKKGGGGKVA